MLVNLLQLKFYTLCHTCTVKCNSVVRYKIQDISCNATNDALAVDSVNVVLEAPWM